MRDVPCRLSAMCNPVLYGTCTLYIEHGRARPGRDVSCSDFRSYHLLPHTQRNSQSSLSIMQKYEAESKMSVAHAPSTSLRYPAPLAFRLSSECRCSSSVHDCATGEVQPPRAAFHAPQSTLYPSRLTSPRSLALETATCLPSRNRLATKQLVLPCNVSFQERTSQAIITRHATVMDSRPQAHGITHSSRRSSSGYEQTRKHHYSKNHTVQAHE